MNKLTISLLSSLLLFGSVACEASRTSEQAPPSTKNSGQVVNQQEASQTQQDATSDVRRNQVDSDIRAREQRNNAFNNGQPQDRDDDDLASEVRSKLEANLPASALAVEAKNGVVTVSGTVPNQEQYNKIGNLTQQIKGVQAVNIKAKVAPAQPNTKS